jgi:hypothetical protein
MSGRLLTHVAAGVSPAVEGGILPPGLGRPNFARLFVHRGNSAGRDARLYGRRDACRYIRQPQ